MTSWAWLFAASSWAQPVVADAAQASATWATPDGAQIQVRAARARWSFQSSRGVLEGQVTLEHPAEGLRLVCDRLEVDLEGGQLATLLATGQVELWLGERHARAGRAAFRPGAALLVLSEGASVQSSDHQLDGDRIEFDLNTDEMHCDRCALRLAGP